MSDYKEMYEENKYILIGSTYGCLEDERWGTRYSPPKMIVVGKTYKPAGRKRSCFLSQQAPVSCRRSIMPATASIWEPCFEG